MTSLPCQTHGLTAIFLKALGNILCRLSFKTHYSFVSATQCDDFKTVILFTDAVLFPSSRLLIWFLSCKNSHFIPFIGLEVFIDRSCCVKWERLNCVTLSGWTASVYNLSNYALCSFFIEPLQVKHTHTLRSGVV